MSSNFKIRILVVILFLIYASATYFMVRMNLIPQSMFIIEIFDILIIFLILMVFIYKIESLEKKKKKY